jgi:hypothetical protein
MGMPTMKLMATPRRLWVGSNKYKYRCPNANDGTGITFSLPERVKLPLKAG